MKNTLVSFIVALSISSCAIGPIATKPIGTQAGALSESSGESSNAVYQRVLQNFRRADLERKIDAQKPMPPARFNYRGMPHFRHIEDYSDAELSGHKDDELSVIVKDRSDIVNVAKSISDLGYKVRIGMFDNLVVKLPQNEKGPAALRKHFKKLEYFDKLKMVAPRMRYEVSGPSRVGNRTVLYTPNDPDSTATEQWHIWQIESDIAWDNSALRISSKKIAVIDSGIQPHDDIDYLASGKDCTPVWSIGTTLFDSCTGNGFTDDLGHGTLVAGAAAATTNNGIGIASPSFEGIVAPYGVFEYDSGAGKWYSYPDNERAAVNKALLDGCSVINMSLGGPSYDGNTTSYIAAAAAAGVPIIASTGNGNAGTVLYPAAFAFESGGEHVIAVGATDDNDVRWEETATVGSNFGDNISLVAPGVNIWTTATDANTPSDEYATSATGTSLAAPLVSGAFANLWYACPALPYYVIRDAIFWTCDDSYDDTNNDLVLEQFDGGTWNTSTGYGRLNMGRAAEFLLKAGVIFRFHQVGTHKYAWTKQGNESFSGKTYDSIAFKLKPISETGTVQLYRRYNSATNDYLLTTNSSEGTGYAGTTSMGYIATASGNAGMSTELYRFFKSTEGHIFTSSASERTNLLNAGWTEESVVGYVN